MKVERGQRGHPDEPVRSWKGALVQVKEGEVGWGEHDKCGSQSKVKVLKGEEAD
jgi:hypothetical protein